MLIDSKEEFHMQSCRYNDHTEKRIEKKTKKAFLEFMIIDLVIPEG